jgi:hypothetical protein
MTRLSAQTLIAAASILVAAACVFVITRSTRRSPEPPDRPASTRPHLEVEPVETNGKPGGPRMVDRRSVNTESAWYTDFEVRVLDGERIGVANAEVLVRNSGTEFRTSSDLQGVASFRATSGMLQIHARKDGVGAGTVTWVRRQGSAPAAHDGGAGPDGDAEVVSVVLKPLATLTVTVLDLDGRTVGGAIVTTRLVGLAEGLVGRPPNPPERITDEAGTASVEVEPLGIYGVSAGLRGGLRTNAARVTTRPGERYGIELHELGGYTVAGRVRGPGGEGIGGARIVVAPVRGGGNDIWTGTALADPDGRYELRLPAPGVFAVIATKDGLRASRTFAVSVTEAARHGLCDVELDAEHQVSGIVVTDTGVPLGGAQLTVVNVTDYSTPEDQAAAYLIGVSALVNPETGRATVDRGGSSATAADDGRFAVDVPRATHKECVVTVKGRFGGRRYGGWARGLPAELVDVVVRCAPLGVQEQEGPCGLRVDAAAGAAGSAGVAPLEVSIARRVCGGWDYGGQTVGVVRPGDVLGWDWDRYGLDGALIVQNDTHGLVVAGRELLECLASGRLVVPARVEVELGVAKPADGGLVDLVVTARRCDGIVLMRDLRHSLASGARATAHLLQGEYVFELFRRMDLADRSVQTVVGPGPCEVRLRAM